MNDLEDGKQQSSPVTRLMRRLLRLLAPGVVWDADQCHLIADGLLGNIAGTFINPFMTSFTLAFGASKKHISILNAVPGLFGNLMQLPASHMVESTGKRKSLILASGVISRLLWMAVIFLPFYAQGLRAICILLVLKILLSVFGSVVTPAWTSLVSDLVPRGVRGRFFSARNIIMSAGALVTVNLAGKIVTGGGFPRGYILSFSIFLTLSWVSLYYFSKISDVPFSPSRESTGESERKRLRLDADALRSPRFGPWIWISTFFNLAVGIVGGLFGAYLVQDLGGTPMHLAYMSFAGTLTGMIGQRFWGPVSDRKGPKFAAVTSACLAAGVPIIWYLAKTPWGGILAETYSGLAWAGWGLGTFNLILDITPEARRPSYIATANVIGGMTGFIAPLIGGYMADLYSLRPLMLVSSAGRLATGILVHKLVAETHHLQTEECSPSS